MAYTKTTDFASKDSLLTGDPAKVVKGSEIDAEFDNIEAAIGTTTGTGAVVLATSPTLVTPVLGTPASGTVTNLTGTASININGTVGATTPTTGAFTTLTASGNVTLGDATTDTVTVNGQLTQAGSSNGAALTAYLKNTSNTESSDARYLIQTGGTSGGDAYVGFYDGTNLATIGTMSGSSTLYFGTNGPHGTVRGVWSSTGLGVGTSIASNKLDVWLTSSSAYSSTGVPTYTARLVNDDTTGSSNYVMQGFVSSKYSSSWWHGLVDTGSNYAAAYVIGHKTGASTYAEALRIDSSGNLLVGVTSATSNGGKIETSNGITFPAAWVGCANANTLDDYEEGTWTPSMKDGSGNAATLTSSTGYYTKIGNLVTASGTLVVQRGALAVTNLNLQGLPFTSKNVTATPALNVGYFTGLNSNVVMLAGYLGANATYAYFQKLSAAGAGMSALTYTDIPTASDATFYFTISYLAAS